MMVLDTIADLKNREPKLGQAVHVLGYHTPGDGGGGMFRYSANAEPTDGATAFAYNADLSAEQSDTIAAAALNGFAFGANVAWGSASLELTTVTGLVTLTDIHLHGHATDANTVNPLTPGFGRLDHKTGSFTDRGNFVRDRAIAQNATSITVKRMVINNARRWVRVSDDVETFQLRWAGIQDNSDSGHIFCWMLNLAKRLGYSCLDLGQSVVVQSGIVEIPMRMTLSHGTIKIRGGDWPLLTRRLTPGYPKNDPEYFVDQMVPYAAGAVSVTPGDFINLIDIELDGNIAENQAALLTPGLYDDVENTLQNSPTWGGFSWIPQNGRGVSPNSFCTLTDCHFHDFGSNCLLGYFETLYRTFNLRLGNSARNHLWYQVTGSHTDLYMYGFAYGTYSKCEGINVINCICENLTPNPYFLSSPIIWNYEGDDWGDGLLREPTRHDIRPGVHWKNVTIRLPDTGLKGPLFGVIGQSAFFEEITIVTGKNEGVTVFGEFGNGFQTGLNRNIAIRNVTVIIRCGPNFSVILMQDMVADHVSVENVTFYVRRGFVAPNTATRPSGNFLVLNIPDTAQRTDPGFLFARSASLKEFAYTADYGIGPVRLLDIEDTSTDPIQFIVENGSVRTQFSLFVLAGAGSSGNTDNWTNNNPEKFQGIWRNVFFDVENFNGGNCRAFLFTAKKLENVSIRWTTVVTQTLFSEQTTSIDQDFTGLTEIDIPTNLFWVPKQSGNVVLTAKNQAAANVLQNYFVSFRDRGNAQTIEWNDLISSTSVDYRAPIVRITVPTPLPAGNVQLEASLRVV